jgi:hypothetical protein
VSLRDRKCATGKYADLSDRLSSVFSSVASAKEEAPLDKLEPNYGLLATPESVRKSHDICQHKCFYTNGIRTQSSFRIRKELPAGAVAV